MNHSPEPAIAQELKSIIHDWNLATEDTRRVTVIAHPAYIGNIRRLQICWRSAVARYQAETGHSPAPEILAEAPPALLRPDSVH